MANGTSLLDLLAARQNPSAGLLARMQEPDPVQLPGINVQARSQFQPQAAQSLLQRPDGPAVNRNLQPAQAAAAPPQAEGDGGPNFLQRILGGVGQAIGGPNDPNLTPEQNRAAQQQAMLQSGFATLASQGRGLQRLGEGGLRGQAVGAAARQAATQANEQERVSKLRADLFKRQDLSSHEGRVSAVQDLLGAGLQEDAQKLINLMGQYQTPQVLEAGDQFRIFDPNTREISDTGVKLPEPPKETSWQQVGDNLQLMDDQTGEPIASLSNPERMSEAELRAATKDKFQMANTLRDDFRADAGGFQEGVQLAQAALQGPANAAGDQTLVIAFNKLLDPASVVREGEFDRVAQIGGYQAQAQRFANRILSDGQLSADSREQLKSEVARLEAQRAEELQRVVEQTTKTAQDFQINPDHVIRADLQQGKASGGNQAIVDEFNSMFGGSR